MGALDVLFPRAANNDYRGGRVPLSLTPDYYMRTPPGKLGNLPMLAIGCTMLVLAVRNTMRRTGPPA